MRNKRNMKIKMKKIFHMKILSTLMKKKLQKIIDMQKMKKKLPI